MIKINLLPAHIRERRRVKALALALAFLLALEVLGFAAYLWAPAPFSLVAKTRRARDRQAVAVADEAEVMDLEQQVKDVQARYASKRTWVQWVEEADKVPEKWIKYFNTLNKYLPAEVVLNGLSLPSGGALTLSGSTRDMMAGIRWYLNMLRCEMVQPSADAVQFSPGAAVDSGVETPGAADPMAMPVTIRVVLKPEYLDIFTMAVPTPPEIGAGSRGRSMGGGGRMGGGGARGGGGRGGMGGGPRGGPRGGRGGRGGGPRMGGR